MCVLKNRFFLLAAVELLLLCGCSGPVKEPTAAARSCDLVIAAFFQYEDGFLLRGGAVCVSGGASSTAHTLDENGEVTISGVPRRGEITLTVFDQPEQKQGSMVLSFSEGEVIDAVTDQDGNGHITVRQDTEKLTLVFVLKEDGSLMCALRLAQPLK